MGIGRRSVIVLLISVLAITTFAQESAGTTEITVLAKQNLALHSKPDFYSNVLGVFQSGEELSAFGRNTDGSWLQTTDGWVNANNSAADGDIRSLRITSDFITLQATGNLQLREGPDPSFNQTATLSEGKLTIAVGRNHDGTWVQTPEGWIPSDDVESDRDVSSLPVTFASITLKAAKNGAFLNAPTWEANVLEIFERGNEAFAHKRTDDGRWVRTPKGWLNVSQGMEVLGDLMALHIEKIVNVTILADASIFARPQASSDAVGSVDRGQITFALSRSEDGLWLEIPFGWISSAAAESTSDLDELPSIPSGIKITSKRIYARISVRTGPSTNATRSRWLLRGDEALAIGRNQQKRWLMIADGGWVALSMVDVGGDILTLPVIDGDTGSTSSGSTTRASSPTPDAGMSASSIRSLVSRHTEDIRILDIEIGATATTIEYDLKPWPFVPNESIANEVAFKIICAIRNGQDIPNTLKLIGQSHFKSDVGRKFTSPSVEIHISARNANRIVCRGNSYSDINWRSLASLYKSYPIPRGASVDYD